MEIRLPFSVKRSNCQKLSLFHAHLTATLIKLT